MDGPAYRPVSAIPLGGRPPGGPDDLADAENKEQRRPVLWHRRGAGIAAIVGALMAILGTAMPWATIGLLDGRQAVRTGWSDPLEPLRWGPTLAVLGLMTILVLTPVVAFEPDPGAPSTPSLVRRLAWTAAALATMSVVVAAIALVRASNGPLGSVVELEFGPFLIMSGALLSSVGAVVAALARPPAMVSAPRAVGAVG